MSQSLVDSSEPAIQSREANNCGALQDQPSSLHSAAVDELLIRYLELLDQYQKQQEAISNLFSSGFLSLAHANLTSTSGHRYGQDYYDERMKATRTLPVTIADRSSSSYSDESNSQHNSFDSSIDFQRPDQAQAASSEQPGTSHTDTPTISTPALSTPANETRILSEELKPCNTGSNKDSNPLQADDKIDSPTQSHRQNGVTEHDLHASDPIRWFGVLVPQSLRATQSTFIKTVDGPICRNASILAELHHLEQQLHCFGNVP